MPRVPPKAKSQPGDWQQAVLAHLREGKLLPIVSNRLHDDLLLGGHQKVVQDYAERYEIPKAFSSSLPAMVQYSMIAKKVVGAEHVVKREYLDFAKTRLLELVEAEAADDGSMRSLIEAAENKFDQGDFSEMAANLGLPRFDDKEPEQNPLLILANFDLPVYLTTSPHRFLERALEEAGKEPQTAFFSCRPASSGLVASPTARPPSVQEPLVYHLHGLDSEPESLVLSEDDHLSFLVNFSVKLSNNQVLPRVREAMADSSLLLLGYDLAAWDFRTVFYGFVRKRPSEPRRQSVCVLQLHPLPRKEERGLFDFYMEQAVFKVVWDDFEQYLRQLDADLRR